MKKQLFAIVISIMLFPLFTNVNGQQKIKVGEKVPEWVFQDAQKDDFTMGNWDGKVLQINYVDPDDSDLNDELNDYIKKASSVDKRIDQNRFKGFGIVDCKSSRKPDGLIRIVAGNKAKKYDTTILFDYDGILQESWGLPGNDYSVVIVDKERICRAVYQGKVPESEFEKIVQLIIENTEK